MAYKKTHRKKYKNAYNSSEKKAYKRGFFAGLFLSKKNKSTTKRSSNKNGGKRELMDAHRRYRERNLGALVHNGKIYDTNFKKGPVEITKSEIKELRKEYQPEGVRMTDVEVADAYVRHMRRKFGVTDGKTGKWLGLLGDVEK
ncbi:MAG: hypothetical protein E7673_02935 [Ruminococcaceae bacterium]|nr:hypothetical protein [Oscillospiraceae bacterium]